MTKINYITNLGVENDSGGWSGMNSRVFEQLQKSYQVNLVENINPPVSFKTRLISKLSRSAGIKAIFPAFTIARLQQFAAAVTAGRDGSASLNFYHGATPWLFVENDRPYAMYLDACFATYIRVYHNSSLYSDNQLHELYSWETEFLKSARAVFFSSKFALEDAKTSYQLNGENFFVAGLGGGFKSKTIQAKADAEPYFLFVGLDFLGKGGDAVVAAFTQIQEKIPGFTLKIAGEKPPKQFILNPAVEYIGFIDKSTESGASRIEQLFADATCFVLPTSKDITPLVLIEAGAAGCPAISVSNFGIPEIIKNNCTGILVENTKSLMDGLKQAMLRIASNPDLRNQLGNNARKHIEQNFTWDKTGEIITNQLGN